MQNEAVYTGVERRQSRRIVANNAALCWAFAVGEGALAALSLFVPAFIYHTAFLDVAPEQMSLGLYLGYALLVGVLHGGSAAFSAARFLERERHPHLILTESVLGWTGAFAVARIVETEGVYLGHEATVEQVRDSFAQIADPAGQQAYMNGGEQTAKFFRKMQGG